MRVIQQVKKSLDRHEGDNPLGRIIDITLGKA
jgi:hypothetical protein